MLGHSQVLQVSPGELSMGNDLNLPFTLLANLDGVAQVSYSVVDLDLVVEELLEGGNVENLVGGRLGGVDDELEERAARLAIGKKRWKEETMNLCYTFLVILPGFWPLGGACRRALVR